MAPVYGPAGGGAAALLDVMRQLDGPPAPRAERRTLCESCQIRPAVLLVDLSGWPEATEPDAVFAVCAGCA